jgi:hypothetical protein
MAFPDILLGKLKDEGGVGIKLGASLFKCLRALGTAAYVMTY